MPKKISELPAADSVADSDELELNQAGVSRRATRGQLVAGLASAIHQHDLADITDARALAALDTVGTAQIDAAAYASQAEAVAGTEQTKIMTAARTAEAIAAQAAPPRHQHELADITDAGALAALDAIRPTEIDPSAYATQIDAAEGLDGTRIMTAVRTAEAIAAKAAPQNHEHSLADVVDAGALAALNTIGTTEIEAAAYASQSEAVAGTDNSKLMTPLRTAQALAAQPAGEHQHELADITDAGALAALDAVGTAEIHAAAYASQSEAVAGNDQTKLMTALRTAEAIAARAAPQGHQHELADIADAGALAALDAVGTAEIEANAVTSDKIVSGAVTAAALADGAVTEAKLSVDAVGPDQLQDTPVAPGSYTNANVTIDQQGRITAASSGSPDGEANTASNVGTNGIGIFEAKVGVDLQFRNLAPASSKISVVLNGTDIELDVVENGLALPATNVTGLAAVATAGTLASLSDLDAGGRPFTNYVAAQDNVAGHHIFVQSDSGREKIFTGSMPTTWTVPMLSAGTHAVVHNMGTVDLTFAADGVFLKGSTTLAADRTAALSWLPDNIVKLTGELV